MMNETEITLELASGETITGTFVGYRAACVKIEAGGVMKEVPFSQIPSDLQRCFPDDPTVAATRILGAVEVRLQEALSLIENGNRRSELVTDQLREIIGELLTENAALRAENTAWMRSGGGL